MTFQRRRAFHISGASWLLLCAMGHGATAQDAAASAGATQLPEITVTAPSPIVRRSLDRCERRRASPAPFLPAIASRRATSTTPVAAAPQQGVLPVVTDQFATVTVVPNEQIRRKGGATLGDLLFSKPGITGSSFAPGASSRPIIRGLDINRVGIVENGIGANGASDLGEDHFVPIDPLATSQIEVIRGPAALRYGSQRSAAWSAHQQPHSRRPALLRRGAVPDLWAAGQGAARKHAVSRSCMTVETRTAVSSVDRGAEGGMLLDAGGGNFAVHADAYGRKSQRLQHPAPSLFVRPDPAGPNGRQPNSARAGATAPSIGGSYIFNGGFIGAAVTQNNALYRIPGIEAARAPDPHRRAPDQAHGQGRVSARTRRRSTPSASGPARPTTGTTRSALADLADPASAGVRQTFTNKEQEGRVEVQLMPFNLRFASVTTALGVQAGHQELTAPSPTIRPVRSTACSTRTTTTASPVTSSTS